MSFQLRKAVELKVLFVPSSAEIRYLGQFIYQWVHQQISCVITAAKTLSIAHICQYQTHTVIRRSQHSQECYDPHLQCFYAGWLWKTTLMEKKRRSVCRMWRRKRTRVGSMACSVCSFIPGLEIKINPNAQTRKIPPSTKRTSHNRYNLPYFASVTSSFDRSSGVVLKINLREAVSTQHFQVLTVSNNKKLSYRRVTARRAMLENSCYVSRAIRIIRISTAKVTFKVIQKYWQWCHSIGLIWFPISLPL